MLSATHNVLFNFVMDIIYWHYLFITITTKILHGHVAKTHDSLPTKMTQRKRHSQARMITDE